MRGLKRIVIAVLTIALVVVSVGLTRVETRAASKATEMTTTMACSVWSRPDSRVEANRVKKIPEGHKVTVIPDVVKGKDGKEYYKTVKGAYIMTKCFSQPEGKSAVIGTGRVVQKKGDMLLANPAILLLKSWLENSTDYYFYVEYPTVYTADGMTSTTVERAWTYSSNIYDEFVAFLDEYEIYDLVSGMTFSDPYLGKVNGKSSIMYKGYGVDKCFAFYKTEILENTVMGGFVLENNGIHYEFLF